MAQYCSLVSTCRYCRKLFKKGSQVYIEGKISNRSYEDKDGVKKYISEVVGREITLLGRAPSSDSMNTQESTTQNNQESSVEDDLPF